jgi:hypothetical protein
MAEKGQDRPKAAARPDNPEPVEALEAIKDALRGLKFGEVTVTVQDGIAVQVERTERTRLRRARS